MKICYIIFVFYSFLSMSVWAESAPHTTRTPSASETLLVPALTPAMAPTLNIITTIKPIASMIKNIAGNNVKIHILTGNSTDPHHFQAKPSDMRFIQEADLVFYLHDHFENYITKATYFIKDKNKIIEIGEYLPIHILPIRSEYKHDVADIYPSKDSNKPTYIKGTQDWHLWLSPKYAQNIALIIKNKLSDYVPHHKAYFEENYTHFIADLKAQDQKIKQRLADIKQKPFMVYHDAYQYFETAYGLNSMAVIRPKTHGNISAHHLNKTLKKMKKHNIQCLLSEAKFTKKYLPIFTHHHHIKVKNIDPLGKDIPFDKNHYFTLLEKLSIDIKECLS